MTIKRFKNLTFITILLFLFFYTLNNLVATSDISLETKNNWWQIQSIDTMKYSRDLAREKLNDPDFAEVVNRQVESISLAGATHLAVGTPYDPEFIPFLKLWVEAARRRGLNVWYRGNFSGWEGWFDYPKINRDEHIELTRQFIFSNEELFQDGDIFTSCTECENGGPGDPRNSGDIQGHRDFLIKEYQMVKDIFDQLGRKVAINYFSMNGDVAHLVMDIDTTHKLGGIVTIDHYVGTPEQFVSDIESIKEKSKGKIVIGEIGVPVPDIHGQMNQEQQAQFLEKTLNQLSDVSGVIGINYWVGFGGTTRLWEDNGIPRESLSVIKKYYNPRILKGRVENELGDRIREATITLGPKNTITDNNGMFSVSFVDSQEVLKIKALGYKDKELTEYSQTDEMVVILQREKESLWFKFKKFIKNLIK